MLVTRQDTILLRKQVKEESGLDGLSGDVPVVLGIGNKTEAAM